MPILCRLNVHRRSAGLARIEGGFVRSCCKGCGTPLVRIKPRTWVPIDARLEQVLAA